MSLTLTHDIVIAAYELLLVSPPFRSWKLPPADEIEFRVTRSKTHRGSCDGKIITISDRNHGNLTSLLATLGHELCHLKEFRDGARPDVHHGAAFNRLADRVCRDHDFDRAAF